MGHKYVRVSEDMAMVQPDDLELIRGIGPGISQRLQKAGVLTFAQLAAMSPTEIASLVAGLAGLSMERITTQNWIGQAQALAVEPSVNTIQENVTEKSNRQHYATFTVELLLDGENGVRRTRVAHVQSGIEESWGTWEQTRLLSFFVKQADPKLPTPQPGAIEMPNSVASSEPDLVEQADTIPPTPQPSAIEMSDSVASSEPADDLEASIITEPAPAQAETEIFMEADKVAEPASTSPATRSPLLPRLHKLAVVTTGDTMARKLLRSDQSFDTQLIIAFEDAYQAGNISLDYSAVVYARSLDSHTRQPIGTEHGRLSVSDNIVLNIGCTQLPPGLYRLEAVLNLGSDAEESRPSAFIEGSLLQVY